MMSNTVITEPEVLTEVPATLKRLVRYIIRGFYDIQHALVMDLLVHHPCIREEDLLDLLKFDQKQLRAVTSNLKCEKFIKVRIRMETNSEGRTNKHNYYFINYSTFVNVVKYKLDHMRRKIEMEERNMTSRASFKCPNCQKLFTDLEAGQLFDPLTGDMRCTFCEAEVEEDSSAKPRTDARTLMVKFNEQIEPIFSLLREVEDVKLAQELLEPEPVDLGKSRQGGSKHGQGNTDHTIWSGERRTASFGYMDTSNVTISLEGDQQQAAFSTVPQKERPIWMSESTIEGAKSDNLVSTIGGPSKSEDQPIRTQESDDIMRTLLAHEKKASAPVIPGVRPGPVQSDESSDSDSETDNMFKAIGAEPQATTQVMESEEEEEVSVTVGGVPVPYHEVTEAMVQDMSQAEKDAYIKIGQEMYEDMYD